MKDLLADTSSRRSRRPWLGWVAGLTLVAGLAVGGLALASSMGIWLGLWDFRTGFGLLRIVGNWGQTVLVIGLVAAVGLFALSKWFGTGNAAKLSTVALIGAIAAALGYYVPASYVPGEGANIPPIHDVSTDTVNPPEYVAVLPLRANAPNTVVYGGSDGMTHERLAALQTEAYPDLTTRTLSDPPEVVFARALAAVEQLGWELVAQVPAEGRIEATDTTFWYRFKDDVVIRIQGSANGTVIDARSLSRVGGGDAGTNAKRLRAFFAAL